jgi:hypothetical protein
MQQVEAGSGVARGMPRVQLRDGRGRGIVEGRVIGHVLVCRIGPVRQQREVQLAVRRREVMHLESLDELGDRRRRRQQCRHRHQRAQRRRNAVLERQARQQRRTEPARDHAVHERDGRVDRRDRAEQPEHEQRVATRALRARASSGRASTTAAVASTAAI